jgi:hypothetical protein
MQRRTFLLGAGGSLATAALERIALLQGRQSSNSF